MMRHNASMASAVSLTPGTTGVRTIIGTPLSASCLRLEIIRPLPCPVQRRWSSGSASFRSHIQSFTSGRNVSTTSQFSVRFDSTAVWIPCARQPPSTSRAKPACSNGSPPDSVTPPPEVRKKILSADNSRTASSALTSRPIQDMAPVGHTSVHLPQRLQSARSMTSRSPARRAFWSQAAIQVPQRMHLLAIYCN